jgi:hypothetical protein
MSLPGVRHVAKRQSVTGGTLEPSPSSVNLSDRVDIYLTLAAAQLKLGHVPEATKVIQDATNEFAGTSEEVRLPPCLLGEAVRLMKPGFCMTCSSPALSADCCSSYGCKSLTWRKLQQSGFSTVEIRGFWMIGPEIGTSRQNTIEGADSFASVGPSCSKTQGSTSNFTWYFYLSFTRMKHDRSTERQPGGLAARYRQLTHLRSVDPYCSELRSLFMCVFCTGMSNLQALLHARNPHRETDMRRYCLAALSLTLPLISRLLP